MVVDREAETAPLESREVAPSEPNPGLVLVHDGQSILRQLVAPAGPMSVGRGDDADLQLDDPGASRIHARLSRVGAEVAIDDLGSIHGVYVNRQRIDGQRILKPGDVVRLGQTLLVAVDRVDQQAALWWPSREDPQLVGAATAQKALTFAERFAQSELSLLLLGDTGTGKDVLANVVHRLSGRDGPLVGVNCAALPADLAESQLFGHRKGSFSGAIDHHRGFFAAADGGTLFLDEVGELVPDVQAKLLRTLETKRVTPVGATDGRAVDVRVVAATCQDLSALVTHDRFREDLYHRVNGVALWLPPLRERNDEIPLLCERFSELGLTSAALEALLVHPWPGNVRQLRQQLQAAAVGAKARQATRIDQCDMMLPELEDAVGPGRTPRAAPRLDEVIAALERHHGNVSHAADELGAHRAQIYRLVREHGIRIETFRG